MSQYEHKRKKHDEILLDWKRDLEEEGYFVLRNLYYPNMSHSLGEIDILAFRDGNIYLFEVKSGYGGLEKGIRQLKRAEKYLGVKCEKYLIMRDEVVYYLGDSDE